VDKMLLVLPSAQCPPRMRRISLMDGEEKVPDLRPTWVRWFDAVCRPIRPLLVAIGVGAAGVAYVVGALWGTILFSIPVAVAVIAWAPDGWGWRIYSDARPSSSSSSSPVHAS
jgi:hypothetical protein